MKKTYFNLPENKKEDLKNICMDEFVNHGYDNSSINIMIKRLGIAKGSFYNYTHSKEDLYLFLLQDIYSGTEKLKDKPVQYKNNDLFDRIEELLEFSFSMFRKNPLQYKFLLQADLDVTSSVYLKIKTIRQEMFSKTYPTLFENINWDQYRFPKEDVMAIFAWLASGIQNDLRPRINSGMGIDEYEEIVKHRLEIYKASLTHGIYQDSKN